MNDDELLAERFEAHRGHLRAVAYRMLGSHSEAEDAVQETWLKLSRADTSDVENLGGWLTTVVGRVCLDMLRSRTSRREEFMDDQVPERAPDADHAIDPEQEAVQADSIGLAMLVVLDTLAPAERLAFVLHDMFTVPYDEIAPIVGRNTTATRQLASRARRRVQSSSQSPDQSMSRRRSVVDAFLKAARGGDFEGLLALLDPDIVLSADEAAVKLGAAARVTGTTAVLDNFAGRARGARRAIIDGIAAAVWAPGGNPRVVFDFTIKDDKILAIDLVADPETLGEMAVDLL